MATSDELKAICDQRAIDVVLDGTCGRPSICSSIAGKLLQCDPNPRIQKPALQHPDGILRDRYKEPKEVIMNVTPLVGAN